MTTDIQTFNVTGSAWRFGTTEDGRPYAVAADVSPSFDYAKTQNALAVIEEDEKGYEIIVTPGGPQRMAVIYEDGLWELIFRSSKPEAKAIKKRVKEILRALRTGELVSARELSPRELAQLVIVEADRADAAEARAAALAPAADHWHTLAAADGDYSVADAAKILSRDPQIKIGRDRLFRVLDEANWVYRQQADGKWRTYQSAVNAGRLSEIPQSHYHPRTGELVLDPPQVRVTPKGIADLRALLGGTVPLAITTGSEQ